MAQTVSRGKKDKSGNSLVELVTIVGWDDPASPKTTVVDALVTP